MITALALPVLLGAAAFGTEEGLLLYRHRDMQHAADSSAMSAAAAFSAGATNVTTQANSVAASYGYVTGSNSTVTVSQPPTSGPNRGNAQAVEVIINQSQPRLFSSLWSAAPVPVTARAVSIPQNQSCVLALNRTANSAFSAQGSVNINLVKCDIDVDSRDSQAMSIGGSAQVSAQFVGVVGGISGSQNITTVNGTVTGYHIVGDPYANVVPPSFSGCNYTNYSTHNVVTIAPGVYCGGISLGAGAIVTMTSGIYYLDRGSLTMNGSTSLTGVGVTLVFTSSTGSNYANASLGGGATLNLVAPTSGTMSGIAIYGDHNMPVGTQFDFRGGNSQSIGGAIDLPKASVNWVGNATTQQPCTQLIADTVQFVGDSGLESKCAGYGTKLVAASAGLLE
jgi:Flp pilus assembly protein TadG